MWFSLQKTEYSKGTVIFSIEQKREKQYCQSCGSLNITPVFSKVREFAALPVGKRKQVLSVKVHRLLCHDCGSYRQEGLPFSAGGKARHTRSIERYVLDLRREMSIHAVAQFTGLNWKTVKDIEKRHLKTKYKQIPLKDVKAIGIDEIYLGKKWKYKTIVIDLESGAVLYIGKGRSADALTGFQRKLSRSKCQIETVAVDMAPSYTKWVGDNLTNATIVYDHFHVIKLMNEKLDSVRRLEMAKARREDKRSEKRVADYCDRLLVRALNRGIERSKIDKRIKQIQEKRELAVTPLKGKRWLLLGNEERIRRKAKAATALDQLKDLNENIALAYQLKELLRGVYQEGDGDKAEIKLENWCTMAEETSMSPMKTMAKTIRKHWKGILSYWTTGFTSAKVEGFNNKIRWLNKQAYGYRDEEYFELKIFDLPKIILTKQL